MLRVAEMITTHYGLPLFNTQLRLTQQLLVSRYTSAACEWGSVVRRYDAAGSPPPEGVDVEVTPASADDEFAAWLANMDIGEGENEQSVQCWHPSLGPHRTYLYRCVNCGNPSAVLRKCSGCGKVRYCDSE
jgi:hypothetical protein